MAPLTIAGTPSFKWQSSNDGTNFADLSVSSVTFGSPYTAASTQWDFGTYNYGGAFVMDLTQVRMLTLRFYSSEPGAQITVEKLMAGEDVECVSP